MASHTSLKTSKHFLPWVRDLPSCMAFLPCFNSEEETKELS